METYKERRRCDASDAIAEDVFKEMFAGRETVSEEELRSFLREFARVDQEGASLYGPTDEFIDRANSRAFPKPGWGP